MFDIRKEVQQLPNENVNFEICQQQILIELTGSSIISMDRSEHRIMPDYIRTYFEIYRVFRNAIQNDFFFLTKNQRKRIF